MQLPYGQEAERRVARFETDPRRVEETTQPGGAGLSCSDWLDS